ncbi:MAG: gamma-glutamyltransferase [Pseudomonadota bacterium]|nr:gamma-glutamyltransferase [Pseudomonadota bacterium]
MIQFLRLARLTAAIGLLAMLLSALASCSTKVLDSAPIEVNKAAIASAHPLATEAGLTVLNAGGNAFDAAITVASALAVVEPYGSGMGGGGYWLLREANGKITVMDAREQAPLASSASMYLDDQGQFNRELSTVGPLAAGIPGQAAALAHLAKQYGQLPFEQSLAPAIKLARGFSADQRLVEHVRSVESKLLKFEGATELFFMGGQLPKVGDEIRQLALANTLVQLGRQGHDGFYRSELTGQLVDDVRQAGGIWTLEDFDQYQLKFYEPLVTSYRGVTLYTPPPSSSGGVVMSLALNLLEHWQGAFATKRLTQAHEKQMVIEAMRFAYRHRALYLGDPQFIDIPVDTLISEDFAKHYAKHFTLGQPTDNALLGKVTADQPQGENTTHFSVVDQAGNMVSATLSINTRFGSGFVSPKTGVLLNNEMDDFSAKVGTQNSYGLTAESSANSIEPLKRPLSSMTPTLFETSEQWGIIGTPGGSRIITMVMLGIMEASRGQPVERWLDLPRYHHQYQPDVIQVEPKLEQAGWLIQLEEWGYQVKPVGREYGNMQAISINKATGEVEAAADPRGIGAVGFYE